MDTHALSEPAFASALEVLAANGVEVMIDADRGYTPTPVDLARDPALQPRPHAGTGRRDRHHAVAQPARGRRLQVQPAQRRPGRHRRHRWIERRGERAARRRPRAACGACRSSGARARRRRTATTTSPPMSTISRASSTWTRSAARACGSASIRSAARACLLGTDRRALRDRARPS